ncbi:paramyosin-like [Sitodiplosis mosellana]|uniref:paramyosin-like n=1 Tax=Sitodiplosis mosellana TaxID=263140 RepID=UPI00244529C6|nr:paramyosin-like [Sitodiplosis mosellana]
MDPLRKIHLNFSNKNSEIRVKVKFGQKLKKAMNFYCKHFKMEPFEVARFFHQDKELFETDSPESAELVDSATINVLVHNPHKASNTVAKTEPNSDEYHSPTDSIQNSESHAMHSASDGNQQVVDSLTMDQMESINETEPQSNGSATDLDQIHISDPESHVKASNDGNVKRKGDNDNDPSELSAKVTKMMEHSDPVEKNKRWDEIERFLDDLVTIGEGSIDAFYVSDVEPLKETIRKYESQGEQLKLDLKQAENKCLYLHSEMQRLRDAMEKLKVQNAEEMKALQSKQQDESFKVKREQSEIEAEIERRVALRFKDLSNACKNQIEQLEQRHKVVLGEQQQTTQAAVSQLDEAKRTHLAEMEMWKRDCADLNGKCEFLLKKHEADMLGQQQAFVDQQKAAENEIHRLRMHYESQLTAWRTKYTELEVSHAKNAEKENNGGIAKRDESIASYIKKVRESHAAIAQWQQSYAGLKKVYQDLSQRYNKDIVHQNNAIVNQKTQYQGQIKDLEQKLNELKAESDKQIVSLQFEKNDYISKWKAKEQACAQLNAHIESMKREYDTRMLQMRQELMMHLQNRVNVPIPTPSPASTPQPPESTPTPPPTNSNNVSNQKLGQKKCLQCGCSCRRAITIPYCNSNCKQEYFKEQCKQLAAKQTDV